MNIRELEVKIREELKAEGVDINTLGRDWVNNMVKTVRDRMESVKKVN